MEENDLGWLNVSVSKDVVSSLAAVFVEMKGSISAAAAVAGFA